MLVFPICVKKDKPFAFFLIRVFGGLNRLGRIKKDRIPLIKCLGDTVSAIK